MTLNFEEFEFPHYKRQIFINDGDIDKIVVSKKLNSSKTDFKRFVDYKDSNKFTLLCILHPQMIIYNRNFDEKRCIYVFLYFNKKRRSFY